ncbi:unnamed protein product [Trichobilharzia regenti]|nr:unnamed protein product [Trichobilharzia regenti]
MHKCFRRLETTSGSVWVVDESEYQRRKAKRAVGIHEFCFPPVHDIWCHGELVLSASKYSHTQLGGLIGGWLVLSCPVRD